MSFNDSDDDEGERDWRCAQISMRAINERLDDLGWVQQDLARASGVSPTTIRWLQNGEVRIYRPSTLSKVSKACGWPAGALSKMLHGGPVPEPVVEPELPPQPFAADRGSTAVAATMDFETVVSRDPQLTQEQSTTLLRIYWGFLTENRTRAEVARLRPSPEPEPEGA